MERRLMTIANAKLKSNFGKEIVIYIHGIYYLLKSINLKVFVACETEVDQNGVYPNLFFEIHFWKITCRSTGSIFAFSFTWNLLLVCCVSTSNLLFKARVVNMYIHFFLVNKRWTCVKKLRFKLTNHCFWTLVNEWWIEKNNPRRDVLWIEINKSCNKNLANVCCGF